MLYLNTSKCVEYPFYKKSGLVALFTQQIKLACLRAYFCIKSVILNARVWHPQRQNVPTMGIMRKMRPAGYSADSSTSQPLQGIS